MKRKASFPAPAERNKKRSAGIFILYKKGLPEDSPKETRRKISNENVEQSAPTICTGSSGLCRFCKEGCHSFLLINRTFRSSHSHRASDHLRLHCNNLFCNIRNVHKKSSLKPFLISIFYFTNFSGKIHYKNRKNDNSFKNNKKGGVAAPPDLSAVFQPIAPWQCLYFFPEPHGHKAFLDTFPQVDGSFGSISSDFV